MRKANSVQIRPMNVTLRQRSKAEKVFRAKAFMPGKRGASARAIAPGLHPTPAHDLKFRGGKTIAALTFTNFYVGGTKAWKKFDRQSIDKALAAAMADQNLNNVLTQYFTAKIDSTFEKSAILRGSRPSIVSQGDIENLVRSFHVAGKLANFPLASTVFNFMLPHGTLLTTDEGPTSATVSKAAATRRPRKKPFVPKEEESSLEGLGGYHGSVHLNSPGGPPQTVYYAVGVYSETLSDGTDNGIPVFDKPWKNVVATFYHELCEARTDPDVEDAIKAGADPSAEKFVGWVSRQGEECGDFPVFEANPLTKVFKEVPLTDGSGTVPIQLQYSNAVHGPEGPIARAHPPHPSISRRSAPPVSRRNS
jgi:hypothetical protein